MELMNPISRIPPPQIEVLSQLQEILKAKRQIIIDSYETMVELAKPLFVTAKSIESTFQGFSQSFKVPASWIPSINAIPEITQKAQIAFQQVQKNFYILRNFYRIPELLSGIALINIFRSFEKHIESIYEQEKQRFIVNFFKEDRYKNSFAKSVIEMAVEMIQSDIGLLHLDINPYKNRVHELSFDELLYNELPIKVAEYADKPKNIERIIKFNQLFSSWGSKSIDELFRHAKERDIKFLFEIRKYFAIALKNLIIDYYHRHSRVIYDEDIEIENLPENMRTQYHVLDIALDIANLTPFEAETFDLYMKGYTQQEIAQLLNKSQSTVSRALRRSNKKLKKGMNKIKLLNRSIY